MINSGTDTIKVESLVTSSPVTLQSNAIRNILNGMQPNNLKWQAVYSHRPYKTKDDFLGLWREQDLLQKQPAEEQINAIVQALKSWDDGGGVSA